MVRNFLFLVIILFLIISCRRTKTTDSELVEAERVVVKSQDAGSYVDIMFYYSNDHPELYMEQLPYDLIMCNAKDGAACYNFYANYLKIRNSGKFDKESIRKLDKPEQDFLIYMLNKGALREDMYCQMYLYYYYKNGIVVKKDSLKADSLSKIFPEGFFEKVDF